MSSVAVDVVLSHVLDILTSTTTRARVPVTIWTTTSRVQRDRVSPSTRVIVNVTTWWPRVSGPWSGHRHVAPVQST